MQSTPEIRADPNFAVRDILTSIANAYDGTGKCRRFAVQEKDDQIGILVTITGARWLDSNDQNPDAAKLNDKVPMLECYWHYAERRSMTADVLKGITFLMSQCETDTNTKGMISIGDKEARVLHLFRDMLKKNRKQLAKSYVNDREKGSIHLPLGVKCSILCPIEALESLTAKCTQCGAVKKLKQCSVCHAVAYCSTECQKLHWKAGHKKVCAQYRATSDAKFCVIDVTKKSKRDELMLNMMGKANKPMQMVSMSFNSSVGRAPSAYNANQTLFPPELLGKAVIVKVQPSMVGNTGACKVCDKKRSFTITVDEGNSVSGFQGMFNKIRAEGEMGGLKAYMTAHIPSKQGGRLKIAFDRVLPAQPW